MLSVLSVAKPRGVTVLSRASSWPAWQRVPVNGFWVFRATREFLDYFGVLEVRGYVAVGYDYDTDCRVYARREIAWAVRAERAWRLRRFCVERALVRRGVLLCEEGYYLSAWRFNWDWRWYDRASWGRRAEAWRSAQSLR